MNTYEKAFDNEYLVRCTECGHWFDIDEMVYIEDSNTMMCQECYDECERINKEDMGLAVSGFYDLQERGILK